MLTRAMVFWGIVLVVTAICGASMSHAAILRVCAMGCPYTLPSQAAAAAHDGDVIEIAAGVYARDAVIWTKHNLTIRGVGGKAHIRSDGALADGGAGLWVLRGNNTTVEHVELSGAKSDGAASGIRLQGSGLTLRDCFVHDNEHGILTNNQGLLRTSDVLIERCEFARNGSPDGQAHNIYIGEIRTFTLQYSYSHDSRGGQLVKSRALTNYVLYNRLVDSPGGSSNYELDLSCGGTAYVIGNTLSQAQGTQNPVMLTFNPEGALHSCPTRQLYTHALYVVHNTFVNAFSGIGYFVQIRGTPTPQTILNNLLVGGGHFVSGAGTLPIPPGNLAVPLAQAGFVDAVSQNYRLLPTSIAVDRGVDPGSTPTLSLAPVAQYVHPTQGQPRTTQGAALDMGAYEAGIAAPTTPLTAPTLSAGVASATSIRVSWTPVLHEAGTVQYQVRRDGAPQTTVQALTWMDTTVPPGSHTYAVIATAAGVPDAPPSNAVTIALPRLLTAPPIPQEPGWYELANTKLRSVDPCPSRNCAYSGVEGVSAVIDDWNSGAFDTTRNRLLLWGGGHAGYYGNEIYALNLDTLTMERLTDPGLPIQECADTTAHGTQPSARHTYDGVTYIARTDQFLSLGGVVACGAYGGGAFAPAMPWRFDFPSRQWHKIAPTFVPSTVTMQYLAPQYITSAYDAVTGLVWFSNGSCLYSYEASTHAIVQRTTGRDCRLNVSPYSSNLTTSIVDPDRRLFLTFGRGEGWKFDLSPGGNYQPQRIVTDGGRVQYVGYPGLAYDPIEKCVIAWMGGDTVYSLNMFTLTWMPHAFHGGPGAANTNGTYKRFAYSPKDDVFVVVNSADRNAFALRLPRAVRAPRGIKAFENILTLE